ncbi:MAG TPA: NAD(P)-dependent oxidoreductase [Polyangiaceae bacterium]|jgi:uroporphyrin-III C-methyltransferase/precorrin-2 dehydrogenase/sirohydrochlorin ferrochelatase|nr:NAD(P)-dependent oxidoreductase [Polyangiaceae bacterium]
MSETPSENQPFPVALKLASKHCVVVGEGNEASARARALMAAGALVSVVTPSEWQPADLDDAWLVVLTARDPELAERLSREAESRRVFFCAVDQPTFGSFTHLALARAGAVFAAIGTGGRAPALARRLRELVQELFDRADLASFAERLSELRERTPSEDRARVLGSAVARLKLEGHLVIPSDTP